MLSALLVSLPLQTGAELLTLGEVLDRYGVWVLILGFLLYKAWPWFAEKFWPDYRTESKAREERRVIANQAEQDRAARLEERQVTAIEKMADATSEMSKTYIQMAERMQQVDERLAQLLAGHSDHDVRTQQAITRMEERTRPRKPDTGELKR